jgi:hypothetical protein
MGLLAFLSLAGCWGNSGMDPQLEARQRELSKQTVSTADWPVRTQPMAGTGAGGEGWEAGTDEPPAPLGDDPQPEEPASSSDAEAAPKRYGDDSVRCGNGLLDPDELCDVSIPEGDDGACPTECPDDDPCRPQVLEVRACWSVCIVTDPEPGACE